MDCVILAWTCTQFALIADWIGKLSTADFLAFLAVVVGVLATIAATVIALRQMSRSNQIARNQTWLVLRDLMMSYEDLVANFRPEGKWHNSPTHPHTVEDWSRIETYMGLFEYCPALMNSKVLNKAEFVASYGFRLGNILSNPRVVTYKLHDLAPDWTRFIALCEAMGIPIPCRTNNLLPFIYDDADYL